MIDRWYGVTCNFCYTTSEILETARLARAAARKIGWTRIPGEQHRGHVTGKDLCPNCTKERVNGGR